MYSLRACFEIRYRITKASYFGGVDILVVLVAELAVNTKDRLVHLKRIFSMIIMSYMSRLRRIQLNK